MLKQASRVLLSRWILPIDEAPRENACLALDGEKILGVYAQQEFEALPEAKRKEIGHDFGEAIICPGLLNLHTHLDYSGLKHFDNYSPFFIWIRGLIGRSWQWSKEEWLESALQGADEIMLSGTSTVLDASMSGAAARAVAASGLRGVIGLELFGINEERAEQDFADWLKKYEQFCAEAEPALKQAIASGRVKISVAPHTPYSVCPALIRKALAWSAEKKLPMQIHISESEAECQWIASKNDDLDEFLKEAFRSEVPKLAWRGHGLSPVKHLEKHELLAEHIVAAHLVQINEADIETLSRHKVSAVHCPRSNSRLRNGVAPMSKMIEAGVPLAFGTDSAASGDDLDVLAEARFAWDLHRAMDRSFSEKAEKAAYYLTLGAAKVLKMDDTIGSLSAGKRADVSVFSIAHLPEVAKQRPYECLIYGGAKLSKLLVDGVTLVKDGYKAREQDTNGSS